MNSILRGGTVVEGSLEATSLNATSKRDSKENINPYIDSALDIVSSVDIISYSYKVDPEKAYHIGFIADDTTPVLSGEKQDHMDVGNSIGILLKAIQEITERLKALEKEVYK